MISVLAFYSKDLSLNPAVVYSFYSVNCLKRMKIKKRVRDDPFFKKTHPEDFVIVQRLRDVNLFILESPRRECDGAVLGTLLVSVTEL